MNMPFPAACLLDMQEGVGILNWCGKRVVEMDAAVPVITFCLILVDRSACCDCFKIHKEDKIGDR